jgi:peptidoglycan/xylan/chitin deacetylase (PgdA/CDA1 family)
LAGLALVDNVVGIAGAAALAAGGLVYASIAPSSQFFGRTLIAAAKPREIALTFDDGPNDAATPQLLDLLARHNVHATFFMMGSFARQRPELARRVAAAGHLIGNHTMTHPKLSLTPAARVREELTECSAVLQDITGERITYFRPPFGARRPAVLRIARELGLTPVMWNVTGFDWEPRGIEAISDNLNTGIAKNRERGRGSNVLLHDGGHLAMGAPRMDTVRAVELLLEAHDETMTRFVTVDAWG